MDMKMFITYRLPETFAGLIWELLFVLSCSVLITLLGAMILIVAYDTAVYLSTRISPALARLNDAISRFIG